MRTLSTGSMSSVILGAATGLRSQLGAASVVARSDPSLPSMFRHPWIRRLVLAAAAGELVVDKLPGTPSRLAPQGIVPRLALGALAASLSAHTRQASWLPAAALGASSAAIAAKLGHDARARLARQAPDLAVALAEDALAIAAAAAGASPMRRRKEQGYSGVTDPRGHPPAAPTAPPELRRAVELAPMRCPIQSRRRCPSLCGNGRREQHRPDDRAGAAQMRRIDAGVHTWQGGAQAELADDADARTQLRSSERLAVPFPCERRRDRASTVVTASRLGASASGVSVPRRSQGTRSRRQCCRRGRARLPRGASAGGRSGTPRNAGPDHRALRRHRLGPRRRGRGRNPLEISAKSEVCDARVSTWTYPFAGTSSCRRSIGLV